MNKVAVRLADGHMINGMTADFFPGKDLFHESMAKVAAGQAVGAWVCSMHIERFA